MHWLIAFLTAYLAGSIPFGLIIGKMKGVDIREHGSKNIGATNVGRVLGRAAGGLCFVLDLLKGALPVLIVGWNWGFLSRSLAPQDGDAITAAEMLLWLGVAIATILGHMYSPFIRFRGGKGVATGFGALLAMWPIMTIPVLAAFVAWLVVVRLTRYVALASMVAAVSVPIFLALWIVADGTQPASRLLYAWPPLVFTLLLALLVIFKHRANISRLRRGEEPKVGREHRAAAG